VVRKTDRQETSLIRSRVAAAIHHLRLSRSFIRLLLLLLVLSLSLSRYIQGASAPTGDGLYEGLDWLSNTLSKRNN